MDPAGVEPASATVTECRVPVTLRALSGVFPVDKGGARLDVTNCRACAELGVAGARTLAPTLCDQESHGPFDSLRAVSALHIQNPHPFAKNAKGWGTRVHEVPFIGFFRIRIMAEVTAFCPSFAQRRAGLCGVPIGLLQDVGDSGIAGGKA